jgi:ankyrin repeat protein
MGAGASSIASNDQRSATSGGSSLLSRISVSSVAQTSKHAKRIQELESQVHELKARLCIETGSADPSRVPHASFQYPVEFNFSDESIDIRAPILPPLDLSCLSAEQAAVSEHLRKEYMEAEAGARDFMRILKKQNIRTMRDCWAQWHQLPLLANDSKMTSNSLPVSSPSPCSSAQSSGDFTLVKTLSDAAVASLKRRDKVYMEEVFNRHAEPVGLCAKDLVSALHEIDEEIFSTNISEADAVIALKKVDSGKKGYATFNEFCIAAKVVCDKGESHEDEDCQDDEIVDDGDELERVAKLQKARDVFLRFAKVKGLTSEALIKALTDVHAPVLLSSQDCSPKQIFRRADANTSGSVDLIEFMRAAELPDDLEMVLEDLHLAVLAPALRAYLLQYPKAGNDQLNRFSNMRREDLFAAVDASLALLKHQLEVVHTTVKKATETKVQLQEAASKEPTKFSTFKASGGTIDNFFEGLEDRIGSPNLEFKKAMCCEHTTLKGSEFPFTSGNYKITTQPKKEWAYVVDGIKCPDMDHGREIKPIHELMKMPLSERAELEEAEVIAIVLYTGPMFVIYNAILRQYPENIYQDYGAADNFFPTTIFVLVSAVQKLSRCMDIPSGTLLFRGLGGSMELPDTFFVPSDKCRTPNALGYTEFGFMSTTADRKVAIQYSGVKEGKPKASIMEIHPNSVDRGADISDFSQYPQEKEFLIVPCSFVQGRGRQRTEITDGGGILSVIPVSVNINLTTETINQLRDKKKRLHIAAFKSLINETMQWIVEEMDKDGRAIARAATEKKDLGDNLEEFDEYRESFLDNTRWELESIMKEHSELGFDEYVDNLKYKALVTRMLNAQEWSKQKLQLWFENQEVKFCNLNRLRIKVCHRRWLSFLRQTQYATADVRSKEERKDAAIKILQCKGLLATDDPSTEKVDDEPIFYAAVADSWAFEDLKFLIDAGANVLELNSESDSALHAALRHRDEQAAITLVEAGADVTLISDGYTPLHLAASEGLASCITALLSKGACINDDVTGYDDDDPTVCVTPMDLAAAAGHISCIQVLMGAGAEVNCPNKNGKTPLYFAATCGHVPCLVFLFENWADVKQCGDEALVAAAENGHAPCVVVLFENGADVKQRGDKALVAAAKNGHAPCLVALIQHGADVNQSGQEALVAAIDYSHTSCVDVLLQNGAAFKDGSSPIHYAAAEYKYDIVLFLLAQGAHVDSRDKDGMTPMHYAAKTRNRDLINLLYEKGADVIAQDNDGKTPMHFAAASGSESCIEFLVTHGAIDSVHARDKDEKTPLHHAAAAASTRQYSIINLLNTDWQEIAQFKEDGSEYEYRDWDVRPWSERSGWWKSCVEFLVANGADVNSQDKDGKTSMHYAATMWNESNRKENPKGKVSYIELLFANGADSNARDKNGKTPLHYAVAVAAKPVKDAKCFPYFFEDISRNIDFFCEKGADVNARDKDGKAPIHCAVLSGSESVIKFLCEKGADVNTQDDAGKAPLHYAIDARGAEATKVIMCLVDKGANVNSRDK